MRKRIVQNSVITLAAGVLMEEFEKANCIRGFHIYQDNWTPILGKRLVCKNGPGNPRDRCAVAVCKAGDEIVGHLPRNISIMRLNFYSA